MKVLCLAHGCVSETFIGNDGSPTRFYNGPSPDEVALVEFAASMDYECTLSTNSEVKAFIPEFPIKAEDEFAQMQKLQSDELRQALE